MNNTKYYNDSLAYDFDLFLPKSEQTARAEIVKMPERKVNKASRNVAKRSVSKAVSIVLLGTLFVAMICAGIALRVEISEVNSQITDAKSELAALSGEETRVDMEISRMTSFKNIEEEAQALGMKKMDKSQIVYIRVNDGNKAVDGDGNVLTAEKE